MKVVALNGSPRRNGNTAKALQVMAEELSKDGIEVEIIHVGHGDIHGCIACGYCRKSEDNLCVFKDDMVNDVSKKMREADGFILASPTYYAGIAGTMKSCLDRIFYSSTRYFQYKVGTSIAVVRRAGGVDVVHQLNNYLNLAQTVTPPSQYWTIGFGMNEGEIMEDGEGIQTIRRNAKSMAWLLKIIDATKESIPLPEQEKRMFTNFIR